MRLCFSVHPKSCTVAMCGCDIKDGIPISVFIVAVAGWFDDVSGMKYNEVA